ncbi:MAG: hypothetical protein LBL31_05155, partial [Spirochaetaceae bacterium]|nr:hypothetical protein [Spirochaetaceae bacterium]
MQELFYPLLAAFVWRNKKRRWARGMAYRKVEKVFSSLVELGLSPIRLDKRIANSLCEFKSGSMMN